ncbi:hypothetical protein HanIR_Chr16g0794331 [Helianthus annuus]|nr:hypothetical protein HanIR_Chr16g0794331 [Helianthus annuus]KAJ0459174.1 hypothetical protein HanHA89_Chr16g0645921 [Helianthus annuus]KAJ0639730.1 hypothetical protein HanLR1_Chr16g0607051 [Helianthus annuus]
MKTEHHHRRPNFHRLRRLCRPLRHKPPQPSVVCNDRLIINCSYNNKIDYHCLGFSFFDRQLLQLLIRWYSLNFCFDYSRNFGFSVLQIWLKFC